MRPQRVQKSAVALVKAGEGDRTVREDVGIEHRRADPPPERVLTVTNVSITCFSAAATKKPVES